MKQELTKGEINIVYHIRLIKIMSLLFLIIGLFGVLFGFYSYSFEEIPSGSRALHNSLIALSYGISSLGWILWKTCTIIRKLSPKNKDETTQCLRPMG